MWPLFLFTSITECSNTVDMCLHLCLAAHWRPLEVPNVNPNVPQVLAGLGLACANPAPLLLHSFLRICWAPCRSWQYTSYTTYLGRDRWYMLFVLTQWSLITVHMRIAIGSFDCQWFCSTAVWHQVIGGSVVACHTPLLQWTYVYCSKRGQNLLYWICRIWRSSNRIIPNTVGAN